MKNIIGVFCIGPNAAACLVQNGRLIAVAEEERFIRNKHCELILPTNAIRYCLCEGKIRHKDVDVIAYAWDALQYKGKILGQKLKRWLTYNRLPDIKKISFDEHYARAIYALMEIEFHHPSFIRQMFRKYWDLAAYGSPVPEIEFVPHHLAHAAAAFFTSGMEKSAVLTVDRNGENTCSALWSADGDNIRLLEKYDLPHSLGWFYDGFTDYLGFRPEYHAGKVMGLAAYGAYNREVDKKMDRVLLVHDDGAYFLDPKYFFYGPGYGRAYSNNMSDLFGPPRRDRNTDITPYYKDIAYAVQDRLEKAVFNLARRTVKLSKSENLCFGGGVSLNCVANSKIAQSDFVDRIHIPPPNNDAQSAIGAALSVAAKHGHDPWFYLEHANWGPGYSDDEICHELDHMNIFYKRYPDIEKVVAQDIAQGKTVAWFQGRMEMGPRALGARSILGDAGNPDMLLYINKIKGREAWRPLSPAILEEDIDDYFINARPSPFMTLAFQVKPEQQASIPSAVHTDGTARPQTVSPNSCPDRFRKLLMEFKKITGVPLFINTSFNISGEPIVCSIKDAVRTFFASGIDEMAIGPAFIKKNKE